MEPVPASDLAPGELELLAAAGKARARAYDGRRVVSKAGKGKEIR
jgi:hypothetical protein